MAVNMAVRSMYTNNCVAIDIKVNGSLLDEKSSVKMLGLPFFYKLDWFSYFVFIMKSSDIKLWVSFKNKNLKNSFLLDHAAIWLMWR